ncbi:MAG: hypothetical protein FJ263_10940 [Planctomycetes bacterium]|nr:hypothetical protein [Planctomycetota bacterium]
MEKQIYQTGDPNDIRAFVELLSFWPTRKRMNCMCCGDLSFEFYKNNQVCQAFSLHHGRSIRVQNQSLDEILLSGQSGIALEKWLTEKGIRKLQKKWEESLPANYDEDYEVQREYTKTPIDPNANNN